MERPAKKIDLVSVEWATTLAREHCENIIKRASNIAKDSNKKARITAGLCCMCFYAGPTIAGAAMTTQPCGICKEIQMYSSTSTDALCLACAKNHELCKHCNADMKFRPRKNKNLQTWTT